MHQALWTTAITGLGLGSLAMVGGTAIGVSSARWPLATAS